MRRPSLLRTMRHSVDRLVPEERADAEPLAAWLDGQMADTATSEPPGATPEPALASVARHLHALSACADAQDEQRDRDRAKARIWEEIMASHSTPGQVVAGSRQTTPPPPRRALFDAPSLARAAARWSPAFNVATVLVLLVALVAGVAGFYGHQRSGIGNSTELAKLAAIARPAPATLAATTTPAPVETPVPTTIGAPAPAETFGGAIPTPAECTVKPLTIDEVVARLGYTPLTPEEQLATRNAAATQIAEFDPNAGRPGPGMPMPESTPPKRR